MPIYDSPELVAEFRKTGKLANIHLPMIRAFQDVADLNDTVIDLGSSVGLLPMGLWRAGAQKVICLEGKSQDRLSNEKLVWLDYYLETNTLKQFEQDLRRFKPKVCTARRVIYEIEKHCNISHLANIMYRQGVKKILIEGCVPVENPRVRLWHGLLKALAFKDFYNLSLVMGNIHYMEAK